MAKRESFNTDFKRFFFRGLGILLPSIVTLWLLWQAFSFLLKTVASPINRGVQWVYVEVAPVIAGPDALPEYVRGKPATDTEKAIPDRGWFVKGNKKQSLEHFRARWNENPWLGGIGLFVAMGLVYLAGVLLGGFFGRQVYTRIEALIARIPGFKQVYPHVKQVVDLIIGDKAMAFNRVVLVEWPRREAWTMGFVTGNSIQAAREAGGGAMVSVFVPTTPTPFTGFVVNVRAEEVKDLPLSIDEALRFIITAGVLTPEGQNKPLSALDRTHPASQTPQTPSPSQP
ncbi:MAG: DUF502 domain-containing protein [Phycisphaeraceae bacterium]|nr:MAG: DUF502 domain-containing protein [Phycisphaeraceae bacterium]